MISFFHEGSVTDISAGSISAVSFGLNYDIYFKHMQWENWKLQNSYGDLNF